MPKTKTANKQQDHLAFVKFTYKWFTEMPGMLNQDKFEIREAYKYFLLPSHDHVMCAVKNYAMQTGCLTADAITKEEFEAGIGVKIESDSKV